jgi:hypothetical protein
LVATGLTSAAEAHTVHIGWVYETNGDVTFYAHNYHGSHLNGGLTLNGTVHNFTSVLSTTGSGNATTATGVSYDDFFRTSSYTSSYDNWAQVVTVSGLSADDYLISTTSTSAVEAPYSGLARTVSLTPTDIGAVPLPAGAVLMLTAMGGFGLARRRRKAAV